MTDTPPAPAPSAGDQGQPPSPPPAPGAAAAGAEAPFWAGLPDHMKGKDAAETLQKLMPSWQGYHKANSERGPAPKDVAEYKFETANEKLKPHAQMDGDPLYEAFKGVALAEGMPVKQFNRMLEGIMGPLAEKGMFIDPKANALSVAKLLGHNELNDTAKAAIAQSEMEMGGFVANLASQLKLSDAARIELESLPLTPGGFELLKALPAAMGQPGMKLGGTGGNPGGLTKEGVLARFNDDRANPMKPTFDKAFLAAAEADWNELKRRG